MRAALACGLVVVAAIGVLLWKSDASDPDRSPSQDALAGDRDVRPAGVDDVGSELPEQLDSATIELPAASRPTRREADLRGAAHEVRSAATTAAETASVGQFTVTFVRNATSVGSSRRQAIAHVACVRSGGSSITTIDWDGENGKTALPSGTYDAALIAETGVVGRATTFEVVDAASEIALAVPALLEVRLGYQDDDGTPVAGLDVHCTRVDASAWTEDDDELHASTDATGVATFDEFACGEWSFVARGEGYADYTFTMEVPGDWAEEVTDEGVVDFGLLTLTRVRPFRVQLVGAEHWGGATGFEVAHTSRGERVAFDESGQALLSLGYFTEPLNLKLWYPTGQEAVFYLDAGMPPEGNAFEIDVGTSRTLEVDLKIDSSAREHIDFAKAGVQVFHVTGRGDSQIVGLEVADDGVYELHGIEPGRALVVFGTVIRGSFAALGLEPVTVRDEGVTSCTLVVEGVPGTVRFVDASGAPLAGFRAVLRELPDRTTWVMGATADEDGRIVVPRSTRTHLSMRGYLEEEGRRVLDRAIELPSDDRSLDVTLRWAGPAWVKVQQDGQPVAGVRVEFAGAHSTSPMFVESTAGDGTTPKETYSVESQPLARVVAPDHWTASPLVELDQGEHVVTLHRVATMQVDGVGLEAIRHTGLDATLAEWDAAGLLGGAGGAAIQRLLRVPAGRYEIVRAGDVSETFELSPAEQVSVDDTGWSPR